MKRRGGGKAKGSKFERTVAKQIVKAFRKFGIEQRDCWRSTLSGGHMIAAGDLAITGRLEKLFPYAVEAKFYKKIDWEHFLLRGKSMEAGWLDQAQEGADKREGLVALLVVKANHKKVMVLVRDIFYEKHKHLPKLIDQHGRDWIILPWATFLRQVVDACKSVR